MLKINRVLRAGLPGLMLVAVLVNATGVIPETSVVIVEEADGEGAINVTNSDAFPVLLVTSLENIKDDTAPLLMVTPPAARVEPGKTQRVRFIMTSKTPLKTERLKRVIFEGVPPKEKGKNRVTITVRQNLPVIIRPAGLPPNEAPWQQLHWSMADGKLRVNNPSRYIVRLSSRVQTLPDNSGWTLPGSWVLPGQTLTLKPESKKSSSAQQVRLFPASAWGFSVDSYDAPID